MALLMRRFFRLLIALAVILLPALAPAFLLVVLLFGCSSDTQAPAYSIRSWPMNVPRIMGAYTPASDVKDGEAVPNIVSLSPCHDKCDVEDEARAIECAKIQDEAQRRACNDSSHEKYKSCIKGCENAPENVCLEKWERCQNFAPFFSCASKTSGNGVRNRCYLCFEDCQAGKAVSGICKKCLF